MSRRLGLQANVILRVSRGPSVSRLESFRCCAREYFLRYFQRRVLFTPLMEQSCYKCGQTVEEGVPFCPHCSAPQIRVVVAEPVALAPVLAAAETGQATLPASQTVPVLALPMQWSQALKPCALAAVIAFLIGLLSQSVIVEMLAAGFLAVIFNGQRRSGIPLRASEAAKLGALAGILCSSVLSLLIAFAVTVPDARSKIQDQCIQSAQKVAGWFPANPDIQASIDQLKTPRGFAIALIWACVVLFFLSIPLAGLGGILGGAVLGRRDRS